MTTAGAPRPSAPSPPGGAGPPPAPSRRWWTLVAVCLGTFMLLLDITIVNVALPAIQQDLHSTFTDLQWVIDAYALALAATLLTAGALADMYGRRRLYLLGLGVFTGASLLCGLAAGTLPLQLSRALQGLGGAVMFAVSLALLADAFRGKERGVAFGIWGAITGLAVAVGPVVGGALTSGLSWRWIFLVNLPVGALAMLVTVLHVAESRDPASRRPDWAGFVTFTGGLSALVFGLIESNDHGFTDRLVLASFATATLLLAVFLAVEISGAHPMFDLGLFAKPTFTGGALAAFGLSASIFAMILYLTLYLQDILGFSALATGMRLLLLSGAILVVSAIAGRVSQRVPVRLLIGPGLIAVGAGLLLMRGLDAASSWTHLIPGLLVSGVGVGMINPPLASTAVGVVEPRRAGMASGISSTFRQVGIATGIALLGSIFSATVRTATARSLAQFPGLHAQVGSVAAALTNGQLHPLLDRLPGPARAHVDTLARAAFTEGLNRILLVAAVIAVACGVLSLALIRARDFVPHG